MSSARRLEWAAICDKDGVFDEARIGPNELVRIHAPRKAYFASLRKQFSTREDLKATIFRPT